MIPRVIAVGNPLRGDDGAAIEVARRLRGAEVRVAGQAGPGLLDLLDPDVPTVILDVVRSGSAPGTLFELSLADVATGAITGGRASSHGLGLGDALALAVALGRALPCGRFVGVEGERFAHGVAMSPSVAAALDGWVDAARRAVAELSR